MQKKFVFKDGSVKNYSTYNEISENDARQTLGRLRGNFERAWDIQNLKLSGYEKATVCKNLDMTPKQFNYIFLEKLQLFWKLTYTSTGKFIMYNDQFRVGVAFSFPDECSIVLERFFNIGENSNKLTRFYQLLRGAKHYNVNEKSPSK